MKKILFLLTLILVSVISVKAQNGNAYKFPTVKGDSLVNVDTVSKVIPITAGYSDVTIQANVKKGTGTLTGKLFLYSSLDGINYQLTDSADYIPVPAWTNTVATYTHTAIINKSTPGATSFIIAATSSGTLTSTPIQILYTARKYTQPH